MDGNFLDPSSSLKPHVDALDPEGGNMSPELTSAVSSLKRFPLALQRNLKLELHASPTTSDVQSGPG